MNIIQSFLLIVSLGIFFIYFPDAFAQSENGSFTFPNGGVVEYVIESGQVNGMEIDHYTKSLKVDITVYGDGRLGLSIPRNVLDAKQGYYDGSFFVLVNGAEVDFYEQASSTNRVIAIQIYYGDNDVEIVGTDVFTPSSNQPTQQNFDSYSKTYYVYVDELPQWADYASNVVYESTKAWEDANPGLKFYKADSPETANFVIKWVKEFGVKHVGYAYGDKFIEVGLGDSNCLNTWQPYSANHVNWIMMHELGHVLGHEHSSDPDSIMYPTAPRPQYDLVEEEFTLAEGYLQFVPFCSSKSMTSYSYSVTTDDPTYGFDVYVVPSINEFHKAADGKTFNYYSGNDCFGENYLSFGGTCEGIDEKSGLLIVIDNRQSNKLTKLIVQQQELVRSTESRTQFTNSGIVSYTYPDSYETNPQAIIDAFTKVQEQSKNTYKDFDLEDSDATKNESEEPSIVKDKLFLQKSKFAAGETIRIQPLIWKDEDRDKEFTIEIYNSKNQLFKSYEFNQNDAKNIFMALEGKNLVDGLWVVKLFDSENLVDEVTFTVYDTVEFLKENTDSICGIGTVEKDGICIPDRQETTGSKGGCLIATATYDTEFAPQVQLLRELRDVTILETSSGVSFMTVFNQFYYSFSPTVADWERQNPIFKESVKIIITPLLSSLSILNYADIDSEQEILGYGIGIILLNLGIYFVVPTLVILKIRSKFNH